MPRLVDAVPVPGALPALGRATAVHLLCLFLCGIAAAAGIWVLPLVAWLSMEGVCAAIIGSMAGLPRWWFPINLLFFPLIYQSLGLEVPPSVFLVVFCAMLLVSGPAWLYRVPLFLSSDRAADKVCRLLPRTGEFRFIDLGCGTGSLLSAVARRRPNGCYTGIELAPLPFLCSCWMALRQQAMCVRWGNFWHTDLGHYDVVYAYLSPEPMSRLWEKARREMRPGSLFISNGFGVAGAPPADVVAVGDTVRSQLHVWRM